MSVFGLLSEWTQVFGFLYEDVIRCFPFYWHFHLFFRHFISFAIWENMVEIPIPPNSMRQGWNFSKGTFTRKLKGNQIEYKRTEAELQMG